VSYVAVSLWLLLSVEYTAGVSSLGRNGAVLGWEASSRFNVSVSLVVLMSL
jgi:hypothetical protein